MVAIVYKAILLQKYIHKSEYKNKNFNRFIAMKYVEI